MAEKESDMEKRLLACLTTGESQWTYRPDIRDEAALWQNFRQKLNQNNLAVLDGQLLTDEEFSQIRDFMLDQAQTPYRAARWLAGENGVAIIPLQREDARLGTIHLMVINSREIAGGHSSYEVINQYVAEKKGEADRERRFDVTLLINGIPMIHIELKNQDHGFMDAFYQIKKYSLQGKFTGLFGMVQMYVVTNGSNTRYIAADTGDRLNENFLTSWVDEENRPVENYLDFAKVVLHVPEAHELIGQYSVLDAERHKLIILRPYQVHAIQKIKDATKVGQSGFIWHTTGSGKTLTSYTVTKNLLLIPAIDKTLFLIDRKDLDQQTSTSFKAYAENDIIDVEDTTHTGELVQKLKSKDRIAIVTTIQKLEIVIKRYSRPDKQDSPVTKRLRNLRIGIVVDECHRTVTPETQKDIKAFFANSLWYGFTGTPIFAENKRHRKGDLARTTAELYGPCLHKYTIKEALQNRAVLGFQIEYKDTISHDTLESVQTQLDMPVQEGIPDQIMEEEVFSEYGKKTGEDIYDTDEHRRYVVEHIVNRCAGKFYLKAEQGRSYEAILTVPSIRIAQDYYRLFQEFIKTGKVSEKIRSLVSDFPKVAITYTVTENEQGSVANQNAMEESMADYNAMFGTKFHVADLAAYNTNLNDRLARKKSRYLRRSEQLDLVIVVDRLLTGFDAQSCAILFIDRPPMSPQNLIQAFSRTNRIFDKSKRYGQIVIFQRAAIYKEAVDEALYLYSNGGADEVSAPSFKEIETALRLAIKELLKIAPTPADVDQLYTMAEKKKFAKAFQKFDKLYGEIQVYDEWQEKDTARDYGFSKEVVDDYAGKYQNVIDWIRDQQPDSSDLIDIDVEYQLESVSSVQVDYRYILALIQSYIPDEDDDVIITEEIEDPKIDGYIEELAKINAPLAHIVGTTWENIKRNPIAYKGQQVHQVVDKSIRGIIEGRVKEFTDKWHVNPDELLYLVETYKDGSPINITMDYDTYSENTDEPLSKLKYRRSVKEEAAALAKEVRPLLEK